MSPSHPPRSRQLFVLTLVIVGVLLGIRAIVYRLANPYPGWEYNPTTRMYHSTAPIPRYYEAARWQLPQFDYRFPKGWLSTSSATDFDTGYDRKDGDPELSYVSASFIVAAPEQMVVHFSPSDEKSRVMVPVQLQVTRMGTIGKENIPQDKLPVLPSSTAPESLEIGGVLVGGSNIPGTGKGWNSPGEVRQIRIVPGKKTTVMVDIAPTLRRQHWKPGDKGIVGIMFCDEVTAATNGIWISGRIPDRKKGTPRFPMMLNTMSTQEIHIRIAPAAPAKHPAQKLSRRRMKRERGKTDVRSCPALLMGYGR